VAVSTLLVGCASRAPAGSSTATSSSPAGFAAPAQLPARQNWAPWPSALHDARHSGASVSAGPTAGVLRWQRHLEAAVTPGPVVGPDGTIYVASNAGVLHALNPTSGADRWTYDSGQAGGGDLSVSPLILPDGTVLWPTPGREIVALSSMGQVMWSQKTPGNPTSPASLDGRRVYVGDTFGFVTAIDIAGHDSPTRAWTIQVGTVSTGSVVVGDGGRLYTTADSALIAIDDQGPQARIAWRADPGDGISEVSAGLAADGTALLGTNGSQEWAYRFDGEPLWHVPRIITYSSPSVADTGLAYVADHSGTVHVFRTSDGTQATTYQATQAQIWSATVIDAHYRVYFGTQSGHAVGLDASGARLFDIDLGAPVDSYPALTADANLIIGARNGTLSAIG
jgi:outer membrane protein assembly factor BamB